MEITVFGGVSVVDRYRHVGGTVGEYIDLLLLFLLVCTWPRLPTSQPYIPLNCLPDCMGSHCRRQ